VMCLEMAVVRVNLKCIIYFFVVLREKERSK
jgi:hypothetical protein